MRADATHRLLLNAPLFHEFSIAVSNEKYVRFTVIEGGNPISYMLRVSFRCASPSPQCRRADGRFTLDWQPDPG